MSDMTKQVAFFFDANRCTGCRTCEVACKVENGVELGPRWRKVRTVGGRPGRRARTCTTCRCRATTARSRCARRRARRGPSRSGPTASSSSTRASASAPVSARGRVPTTRRSSATRPARWRSATSARTASTPAPVGPPARRRARPRPCSGARSTRSPRSGGATDAVRAAARRRHHQAGDTLHPPQARPRLTAPPGWRRATGRSSSSRSCPRRRWAPSSRCRSCGAWRPGAARLRAAAPCSFRCWRC